MSSAKHPNLRAVKAGEKAPVKSMSVADAASRGTRRDLLVATRDRIARTVDNPDCPPRDLAALTRRLTDIAKEIEALDLADRQEEERSGRVEDESFDVSAV